MAGPQFSITGVFPTVLKTTVLGMPEAMCVSVGHIVTSAEAT